METEDELVRRSRSGDHLAFARLVEEHQVIACRVAVTMVGWGGAADDVVQDAFVNAFTRLDQLEEGRRFRPWLLAIVANGARNHHRSTGRRAALVLRVATPPDAPADPSAPGGDPARAAMEGEARRHLAAAVASLPDRDREVVALRYFAELSEAETAAALGCPVGTVKSRLSRALARLRAAMAEEVRT